jgi:O-antigen ligase
MGTGKSEVWFERLLAARTFALVVVAASVGMPFSRPLNGGAIIGTATFSLALGVWEFSRTKGAKRPQAAWAIPSLMVGMFVLFALGLLWVSEPGYHPNLDVRLGFVAFPAMLFFFPFSDRERDIALFWFCVSVTMLGLVLECVALRLYLRDGFSYYFVGESLVYPVELHRVYTSLHLVFALAAVTLSGKNWGHKYLIMLWQVCLAVLVVLMASRNVTAILVVLVGLYAARQLLSQRRAVAIGLLAGFGGIFFGLLQIPALRAILTNIRVVREDWGLPAEVGPYDGVQVRHYVWQCAQAALEHMPFYGYGTSTARYALLTEYQRINFQYGIQQMLNAHNQYWEVLLDLGWVGIALLLSVLAVGVVRGIRQRHTLLATLMLIAFLAFVTESYLEAQKGAVFFTLFWCLLGSAKRTRDSYSLP